MKNVSGEDLVRVVPASLRTYLERGGWSVAGELANGEGVLYELVGCPDAVLVPRSNDLGDYAIRMAENVALLADHENRDPETVLHDLMATHEDVLRVHDSATKPSGSSR